MADGSEVDPEPSVLADVYDFILSIAAREIARRTQQDSHDDNDQEPPAQAA